MRHIKKVPESAFVATELFNPNKYRCWLTGYGAPVRYMNPREKPTKQVREWLERDKKKGT